MKLYEIPKLSRLYNLEPNGNKDDVVIFDHLDGMYSYCFIEGKREKGPVHLSANFPLRPYRDGYEYDPDSDDNIGPKTPPQGVTEQ